MSANSRPPLCRAKMLARPGARCRRISYSALNDPMHDHKPRPWRQHGARFGFTLAMRRQSTSRPRRRNPPERRMRPERAGPSKDRGLTCHRTSDSATPASPGGCHSSTSRPRVSALSLSSSGLLRSLGRSRVDLRRGLSQRDPGSHCLVRRSMAHSSSREARPVVPVAEGAAWHSESRKARALPQSLDSALMTLSALRLMRSNSSLVRLPSLRCLRDRVLALIA